MNSDPPNGEQLKASATIIADMAEAMPIGGRLTFSNRRYRFDYEGPPVAVWNWADFAGSMLMVHVGDDADQDILGSAVLVGPGIALTARHVIQDREADIRAGRVGLLCSGVTAHGLNMWRPHEVVTFLNTDLAILLMVGCSEMPPGGAFDLVTLTTRLPPVGERVCLAGYRVPTTIEAYVKRGALYLASGKVLAQPPLGRDRLMLPWPVIEIDTPALGGMSGGAVFDANGAVCALITSSYDAGPSYASLIWPTLQTPVNQTWPPGAFIQGTTLTEIGAPFVSIDGPEAVTKGRHPVTGEAGTRYEPWS